MKINKKNIAIIAVIVGALIGIITYYVVVNKDRELTYDPDKEAAEIVLERHNLSELYSGNFYIWSNPGEGDIKALAERENMNVFKILSTADNNFDADSVAHVFWYNTLNDRYIPTMYEDDILIYISNKEIPYNKISWERFADYGYTIGIIGLIEDESGHYHLERNSNDNYNGMYYGKSDAKQIKEFTSVPALFLDKVSGMEIRSPKVSPIGTVEGLIQDTTYICEWYTGSYYQDLKMTANTHMFGFLETFDTYDYDFIHSDIIIIKIPKWIKTGYYYINGEGFFRYVKNKDKNLYNGEPYDKYIDWNDPIIVKDKEGNIIYNPTDKNWVPEQQKDDYENSSDSGYYDNN